MNSLPINLEIKDNVIPGMDNEIITVQKDRNFWEPCYKIISKGNHFNPMNGQYRTFKIEIKQDNFMVYDLPPKVIFYATTFENSFGYEDAQFLAQRPHVTEIPFNHHVSVSYKTKKIEYLKEKRSNCEEETFHEAWENAFLTKAKETCQNPCFPSEYPLPKDVLKHCDVLLDIDVDFKCSKNAMIAALTEVQESYSNVPCKTMYYEGFIVQDYLLEGMKEIFEWYPSDPDIMPPIPVVHKNPGNITAMFSYNFELPETMTVEVESYIFTFMDMIGIVGGTLSMFVGFACYDNLLSRR